MSLSGTSYKGALYILYIRKEQRLDLQFQQNPSPPWLLFVCLNCPISHQPQDDNTFPDDVDQAITEYKAPQFPAEPFRQHVMAQRRVIGLNLPPWIGISKRF